MRSPPLIYCACARISFYMKLIAEIIDEFGGEYKNSFTVCPGRLAYFKNVRAVAELSPEKITLVCGGYTVDVNGAGLTVREYYRGDMAVEGDVFGVAVQRGESGMLPRKKGADGREGKE